jgi:uncharacterized protein
LSTQLALRNVTRDALICPRMATADSLWSRFRGLMLRDALPADEGLWFPGTSSIHMMFMRFPIDCLFLGSAGADGERTVVGIREGLAPWTGLAWQTGADGVAELAGGVVAASRTRQGDLVRLEPAD